MTRKSNLSPVRDAPASGLDLTGLRNSVGAATPASLRAIPPLSVDSVVTEARSRLTDQHSALRAQRAFRDRLGQRQAELQAHQTAGEQKRGRLEADLAKALAAGDPVAVRQVRQALEDIEVTLSPTSTVLSGVAADYQRACSGVDRAETALRQAAVGIICSDSHQLLETLRGQRQLVRETELRLLGLRELLTSWGWGLSAVADELREAFPVARASVSSPTEAHRAEWSTLLNQLLTDEEDL